MKFDTFEGNKKADADPVRFYFEKYQTPNDDCTALIDEVVLVIVEKAGKTLTFPTTDENLQELQSKLELKKDLKLLLPSKHGIRNHHSPQ